MNLHYQGGSPNRVTPNRSGIGLLRIAIALAVVGMGTFGCTNPPPPAQQNHTTPPARGDGTPPNPSPVTSVLPQKNAEGDYVGKSNHIEWRVVDTDENGLNCRMGDRAIEEVWNPSAGALNIGAWPSKGTLKTDTTFKAELSPGGFVLTFDANKQPWIFVRESQGNGPSNCFVRANANYIQPILSNR